MHGSSRGLTELVLGIKLLTYEEQEAHNPYLTSV